MREHTIGNTLGSANVIAWMANSFVEAMFRRDAQVPGKSKVGLKRGEEVRRGGL